MKRMIRILALLVCMLAVLCVGFAAAEAPKENPGEVPAQTEVSPSPTPMPTPSPEDLGKLTFVIERVEGEGADAVTTTVTTVPYSEFNEEGKFLLENLAPGTYTVREVDPDKLLEGLAYTYDTEKSVQTVTFEVKEPQETVPGAAPAPGGEQEPGTPLLNVYVRELNTPEPTPEVSEPPENPDEKINIPVAKVWDDAGNRDNNRPGHVTVHLLADGKQVNQAVLAPATGWTYEFKDLPKYSNGKEIAYTLQEDPVNMYVTEINGYTITNRYRPPTTKSTVSKVWEDDNNLAGIRPASIVCYLNNGMYAVLSAENNWTVTVDNLPATVNGRPAVYTWSEPEIIGYVQTGVEQIGNTTILTNSLITREETPPEGKNPPNKKKGNNYLIINDYGTPLGVDVVINHVGDCFD